MWLEVSPPTAKKIFLAIFQCLRAQNRNLLLPPPIGDE
jgi:hypothetical protein